MYRIAIVEDEQSCMDTLKAYLEKLAAEKDLSFEICCFKNAVLFLENYTSDYHLVFMDIRMPYLNGMDAAHSLRELDPEVLLIFVTSMAHYAVKGYEVSAFDYIVKPVTYPDFALKMARAIRRLSHIKTGPEIVVPTPNGMVRLSTDEIRYIETLGHHLIYHMDGAKTHTQYATLASVEEKLKQYHFARCNNCYLVNLKFVQRIKGYTVSVDGVELQISQPRKKEFLRQFLAFSDGRSS